MAEMVVDYVTNLLQKEGHSAYPKSTTKHMPISGGHVDGSKGLPAFIAKSRRGYEIRFNDSTGRRIREILWL